MTAQTSAASLEMTNDLLIEKLSFCIIFCQWSENRALIKQSKLRKFRPNWMRAFRPVASDQVSRLWNTTSACCLILKDTYSGATDSNWCQADTVVHWWISVVWAKPHAQRLCEKMLSVSNATNWEKGLIETSTKKFSTQIEYGWRIPIAQHAPDSKSPFSSTCQMKSFVQKFRLSLSLTILGFCTAKILNSYSVE